MNFRNLNLIDKNIIEMIIKENKTEMIEFLGQSVPNISLNVFKSNLINI